MKKRKKENTSQLRCGSLASLGQAVRGPDSNCLLLSTGTRVRMWLGDELSRIMVRLQLHEVGLSALAWRCHGAGEFEMEEGQYGAHSGNASNSVV